MAFKPTDSQRKLAAKGRNKKKPATKKQPRRNWDKVAAFGDDEKQQGGWKKGTPKWSDLNETGAEHTLIFGFSPPEKAIQNHKTPESWPSDSAEPLKEPGSSGQEGAV